MAWSGADERTEHSLDEKFLCGDQVWIFGIFRPEERTSILDEIALERCFAVDECRDDIAVAGFRELEDDDVAIQDAGSDHRISAHLQRKGARIFWQPNRIRIDSDAPIWLLVCPHWQARRNGTQERDIPPPRGGWLIEDQRPGQPA